MNNNLVKTLNLAMVSALPDAISGDVCRGRLKNLYRRLKEAAISEIERLPYVTDSDKALCGSIADEFKNKSGWGRSRHVLTYVNFCLGIMDSGYPKITEILNDIYNYFDRAKKAHWSCIPAGGRALDIWENILKERGLIN